VRASTKVCPTTQSKKPLGRPTRRWEKNIKMGLTEIGRESSCEKGNDPSSFMKGEKFI
jgi:hypothetical protein